MWRGIVAGAGTCVKAVAMDGQESCTEAMAQRRRRALAARQSRI
jgi:hypothetical protein